MYAGQDQDYSALHDALLASYAVDVNTSQEQDVTALPDAPSACQPVDVNMFLVYLGLFVMLLAMDLVVVYHIARPISLRVGLDALTVGNAFLVGVVSYDHPTTGQFLVLENRLLLCSLEVLLDIDDCAEFTLMDEERFFPAVLGKTGFNVLDPFLRLGVSHHHSILTHHSSSPHFSPLTIGGHLFTIYPDYISPGYLTTLLFGSRFVDVLFSTLVMTLFAVMLLQPVSCADAEMS